MYLQTHSTYSFQYGTLSPERLSTLGKQTSPHRLTLTDINNMAAHAEFATGYEDHAGRRRTSGLGGVRLWVPFGRTRGRVLAGHERHAQPCRQRAHPHRHHGARIVRNAQAPTQPVPVAPSALGCGLGQEVSAAAVLNDLVIGTCA